MEAIARPYAQARDDHAIFAGLARCLGVEREFTEGRDVEGWLRQLYEQTRVAADAMGRRLPDFDTFWRIGEVDLPTSDDRGPVPAFRTDPAARPLETPSGKVELASPTIAAFGYEDCPGVPTWLEPTEWQGSERAGRFPLLLIANQPARRLHSQLDFGAYSSEGKLAGRETVRMHPRDAAARDIKDGDVVRLVNDRGACLAGAQLSDELMPGVIQMPTGSWYAPRLLDGLVTCLRGNPNAVTSDRGTSRLAQGSTGQHALVEVERYGGDPPEPEPHGPPSLVARFSAVEEEQVTDNPAAGRFTADDVHSWTGVPYLTPEQVAQIHSVEEFEPLARERTVPSVADYVAGWAGTGATRA